MFGVDEGASGAGLLSLSNDGKRHRGLTGRFRTVDLNDPTFRQTANAERDVQAQRASGNGWNRLAIMIAHAHDRAFTELLFDLAQGGSQGALLVLVHYNPHLIKRARGHDNCISRQY